MITVEESNLSKLSYVDKDFAGIYTDLLDLARQLTNKWNPDTSNESDPFVVMLKEMAFVGDHLNYNDDKNTLEGFLPSATQDISARAIVETNGYSPRYYVSGNGYITFSFNPTEDVVLNGNIPRFTLSVSNQAGDITYTQVEDLSITAKGIQAQAKFIEGSLRTLDVNGTGKILLENIDSNYRLYFPVSNVAQNGVFIRNYELNDSLSDYWERSEYLLTLPSGSKCFKVDYDSTAGLPYIEFPTDLANIIGAGLEIQYIFTSGENGNTPASTLTNISVIDQSKLPQWLKNSDGTFSTDGPIKYLSASNLSSIINGKDPETINEMYQSFKKIVGTFNTLVTCKDYENVIFVNYQQTTMIGKKLQMKPYEVVVLE